MHSSWPRTRDLCLGPRLVKWVCFSSLLSMHGTIFLSSACAWREVPGFLPKGARVCGMSSVGSIVYFMGHGLDPTTSSPVVHCNMANFKVKCAIIYYLST